MNEDRENTFVVITVAGNAETTVKNRLTHAEAMQLAEELHAQGGVVRVMHVIGGQRSEVDHYPPR